MAKQEKLDRLYMNMAKLVSEFSYCTRKKVGTVIVKDDIIVIGYNGSPSGLPNVTTNEDGSLMWETLHSETNALSKITNSTITSTGATVYSTFSACRDCSKHMIQSKIKRFVYLKEHSDTAGLELMKKCGIIVEQMTME